MRIPFLRSYSAFTQPPAAQAQPGPFQPSISSSADLEKNISPPQHPSHTLSNNGEANVLPTGEPPIPSLSQPHHHQNYEIPPSLIRFQNIIGISVPPSLHPHRSSRPAQNLGIYKRVVDKEKKTKLQLKVSQWTLNICYFFQIIFGAALTALGAAGGPSRAVTALGAISTILAGLLTYLKGQGLPGRLEQHFSLLRTLREFIEERERDFAEPAGAKALNVEEEIAGVVRMYQEIGQAVQDNMPGNIRPPAGNISGLVARRQEAFQAPVSNLKARIENISGHGGEKRVGEGMSPAAGAVGSAVDGDKKKEGKEMMMEGLKGLKAAYSGQKAGVEAKTRDIRESVEDKAEESGQTLHAGEEQGRVASESLQRLESSLKRL